VRVDEATRAMPADEAVSEPDLATDAAQAGRLQTLQTVSGPGF